MSNTTISVEEFVLHCVISSDQRSFTIVALVFIYLVSLIGNLLVLFVITTNQQLQTPMYIYISALAVIDLVNSTIVIPKMLADLHFESSAVPYGACLLQMYVILNFEEMESILLMIMAIDRYIAIIHPLRYRAVVTMKVVWIVVLFLPVFTFLVNSSFVIFATELSFCRSNILHYCFCDYFTMVQVACNHDPKFLILLSCIVFILGLGPFLLIIFSYIRIGFAALKISSVEGKRKVYSTCLTHLLVVGFFYFPLLTSYILPGAGVKLSVEVYNTMVIIGNVIPPMMNPIIYSFRNKEIKSSIHRFFTRKRTAPDINGC
ncbi:olfactory receptor 1496-like [Erpetoichthys calabaricus]|uniref:olfactory receptor 1496-like n=1 Tax=Erpetoichthys calabaricus TaxID=27687 RepID=UPI00109F6FE7|nr:olfactory receptor 1496-like [Erpetoichthys calabaricus]